MGRILRGLVGVIAPMALGAQGNAAPATYVTRGRVVEARQKALGDDVSKFHKSLGDTLRRWAPDLLPRLEPPPGIATGYQLLPRILPSQPNPVPPQSQLVSYGWNWSETLMQRTTSELTRLEKDLAASSGRRSALDSLVTGYRGLVDGKRRIDADINYNWLWQEAITRARPVFDRNTAVQDAILRLRGTLPAGQRTTDSVAVAGALATDVHQVGPPAFLTLEHRGSETIVTVPMITDIEDSAFVSEFVNVVTSAWEARSAGAIDRVAIAMRRVSPRALYCGANGDPACAPPAKGAAINMSQHLAKFPDGAAILTTGALSSHYTGGRAIVLSPHDAPTHLLVHEFGHVLGFPDAYIRGYRDAGRDGFIVTELVVDNADVMGNSRDGSVRASHFERLRYMAEVPVVMRAGLDAFYQRGDARTAVARFQEVLRRVPNHYGATYQLAKALDAMGATTEAAALWSKVLLTAQQIGDSVTARQAQQRLTPRR